MLVPVKTNKKIAIKLELLIKYFKYLNKAFIWEQARL